MLVLTRKRDEVIVAGEISVRVLEIRGNKVRLGVEAPREVSIDRLEVDLRKREGQIPADAA